MAKQSTVLTFLALLCVAGTAAAQSPIQIALVTPIQIVPETQSVRGLRLNLIYGSNVSVVGLDLGLVNRTTGGVSKGVQWGAVSINDGGYEGWSENLVNLTRGRFVGLQSGGYNSVGSGEGVQWGVVNYSEGRFSGLQFSLVNYAQDLNGLQIGLINIIKSKSSLPILPLVNWKFDD